LHTCMCDENAFQACAPHAHVSHAEIDPQPKPSDETAQAKRRISNEDRTGHLFCSGHRRRRQHAARVVQLRPDLSRPGAELRFDGIVHGGRRQLPQGQERGSCRRSDPLCIGRALPVGRTRRAGEVARSSALIPRVRRARGIAGLIPHVHETRRRPIDDALLRRIP